ncbi:MAG TPA: sugar phosphate isomerase/epimerase [Methanosphaera sp.]|nr:sugar phosphate isomerase/epimerase [Methanosphaera sp.]
MKISVSTLGMYPAKMENILEFVDNNKLEYLEIITEYPYKHVTADDLSNYDLGISIHAPMSDINISSHVDKIREASIEEMVCSFKKANELDAQRVTVHPGSIPVMALKFPDKILDYNIQSLQYLQTQAEEYGVMMCVENMPMMERLLYTNIEALYEDVAKQIHSGITLDVGHGHNNGFSVDEMLKSRDIHHIHLSDNDGSYDMHDALGTHDIDFIRLFELLEKNKYDDICVIEVYTVNQILKSIDYLKQINIL